ncbi:hypothetical protein E2C11_16325 [Streptomyces lavendulae]|nr:hypothetical protein [Streptomyces lavendulae]TXJ78572.1 hypothetical protein E2C11_16325 [Streptomyces lavendulae]
MSAAEHLDRPGGKPVDPTASAFHLMAAQAHFAAAQVAAAVDQLADRYVGDGPHINEWRNAVSWLAPTEIVDNDAPTPGPRIPGRPYSPAVETALRNLNLAGHVTPADTLAAAIPVIAGHVAEALVDSENVEVRKWARSITDELKRIGLDLRGAVEYRVEDLNGGQPFSYEAPLGYSDEPPF